VGCFCLDSSAGLSHPQPPARSRSTGPRRPPSWRPWSARARRCSPRPGISTAARPWHSSARGGSASNKAFMRPLSLHESIFSMHDCDERHGSNPFADVWPLAPPSPATRAHGCAPAADGAGLDERGRGPSRAQAFFPATTAWIPSVPPWRCKRMRRGRSASRNNPAPRELAPATTCRGPPAAQPCPGPAGGPAAPFNSLPRAGRQPVRARSRSLRAANHSMCARARLACFASSCPRASSCRSIDPVGIPVAHCGLHPPNPCGPAALRPRGCVPTRQRFNGARQARARAGCLPAHPPAPHALPPSPICIRRLFSRFPTLVLKTASM
jgi:hypothetical protein